MRYHELAPDDKKEYDRRLELITYIIQYYTNQFFSLRMHFQPNDQIFHVSREEFNRRMKLLHPLFTIGIEDGETVGMWEHNSILEWFQEINAFRQPAALIHSRHGSGAGVAHIHIDYLVRVDRTT